MFAVPLTCLVCGGSAINCNEEFQEGLSFLPHPPGGGGRVNKNDKDADGDQDGGDKENSSIFHKFCRELLHIRKMQLGRSLSLCPRCRDKISCVMDTKRDMEQVEGRIHSLQLSLLEELKGLQGFVDVLEGQLKGLEGSARKTEAKSLSGASVVSFGGKKMLRMRRGQLRPVGGPEEGDDGGTDDDDAAIFRKSLSEVTTNLRTFRRDLSSRFYSLEDGVWVEPDASLGDEIQANVKMEPESDDDTFLDLDLCSPSQSPPPPTPPGPDINLEEVTDHDHDDEEEDPELSGPDRPLQRGSRCRRKLLTVSSESDEDDDDDHHHNNEYLNEDLEREPSPSPAFESYLEKDNNRNDLSASASSKYSEFLEDLLGLPLSPGSPPSPSLVSSQKLMPGPRRPPDGKPSPGKKTSFTLPKKIPYQRNKIISREFISSDSDSSGDDDDKDKEVKGGQGQQDKEKRNCPSGDDDDMDMIGGRLPTPRRSNRTITKHAKAEEDRNQNQSLGDADAGDDMVMITPLEDVPLSLRLRMRRRNQSPGRTLRPSKSPKRRRVHSPLQWVGHGGRWGNNSKSTWARSPSPPDPDGPERNSEGELLKGNESNFSKPRTSRSRSTSGSSSSSDSDNSSSSSSSSSCSSSSSTSVSKRKRRRKVSKNIRRRQLISSDSDSADGVGIGKDGPLENDDQYCPSDSDEMELEGGHHNRRRSSSLKTMKKIKETVVLSDSDEDEAHEFDQDRSGNLTEADADDDYEPESEDELPDPEKPKILQKHKRKTSLNPNWSRIDFAGMSPFRKFIVNRLVNKQIVQIKDSFDGGEFAPNTAAYCLRQVEQERMSTAIEYNPEDGVMHVKNVEILINDQDHTLECSQCPYKMDVTWPLKALKDQRHFAKDGKRRFRSHVMMNHHPTDFTCPVCPANGSNATPTRYKMQTYVFHLKAHMNACNSTCPTCGKPLQSGGRTELMVHLRSHMSEEERLHDEHGMESFRKIQLSRKRYDAKRKEERVLCPVCGNSIRKAYFTTHMKKVCVPEGFQRIKCHFCDKTFKCKPAMEKHIQVTHSRDAEERPFHCHMCPGRFKAKEHLTVHLEIHAEERIYQCGKGCGKDFARKRYWRRHEATCKGPKSRGKMKGTETKVLNDPLE